MDTDFEVNSNCVSCGRCVKACQENGLRFLIGYRDNCPHESSDYVPCHRCTDLFSKPAPCKEACYYNAIKITRN